MSTIKASLGHKRIRRLVWLVLAVFVLLGYSFQSAGGSAYYSMVMRTYATVSPPPVILQAGTAGTSTIYTNSTSAKVSVPAPAPVPTYYPNGYSVLSGNWWNLSYGYRKKITVVNNAGSSLGSGYSVCLTENTTSLISAGKLLSSGNDLRIVYWNATSSSWVELDRDLIDINTGSTKVWFKTQASIGADSSDSNYYMYYGSSSAGSPPANKNNVYLFYDDFDGGTLDTDKWTVVSGTPTIESTELNLEGSVELKTVASFDRGYVWEQDVKAQADGRLVRVNVVYADASNNYHAHIGDYGFRLHDGSDNPLGNTASYVTPSNHLLRFTVTSNTLRVELINKGNSSVVWDTGTVTDTSQTGTKPVAFRYSLDSGTIHFHHDNMKIRSYVSPEPSVSGGTEELSYYVSGTVPASIQDVDSDYLIIRSAASATSASPYNPFDYDLLGSTQHVSGGISNLETNNGVYMSFRSYYSGTNVQDFVDNNSSDVDSSANKGTHSNFSNQQAGPDSSCDTLTEDNATVSVALIVGNPSSPSSSQDVPFYDHINAREGWSTTYLAASPLPDVSGYDMVEICYSVGTSPDFSPWKTLAKPILIHDRRHADDIALTTGEGGYTSGSTTTNITDNTHYITQPYSIGNLVISSSTYFSYTSGISGDVDVLATMPNQPTRPTLIEVDTGETLSDGVTSAPARRVYYPPCQYSATGINNDGWAIFDRCLEWLATYYRLDLEVQWTSLDYDETYEELCIYGGAMGAENITVDVRYNSVWQNVFTDLAPGWNNVSVSSYLDSSVFTIRFKGGNETGDTTPDSWDIDATLLHVWSPEYTMEVEFIGSSNIYTWTQIEWTVDSAWTNGSVNVILQLYDYSLGDYPSSGNGYMSHTSNATANTDETRSQNITFNPTHFGNATGYWKMKVKGVKATETQFDFKADWIEFKPTYYSEYTVSTEFLLSGMTTNTPTQLNFTAVSEYDIASVNVTIQVWNYSSSTYVTSGEGYSTYTSAGANETKLLSINTNPQFLTSSGMARIKTTGVLTTTTQYQQETNQIRLVYKYDASSAYDYVLAVTEQDAANWTINLQVYGSSNIASRALNTTIGFRDGTTSDQIIISGGSINQSEGPSCNLTSSATIYIEMSNVDATSSGISFIYVHLKILVPDTSTYLLYIITFEIT